MDLQALAIVVDKAKFSKLVHEMAHARTRRSDHFGKQLLVYLCDDWLGSAVFAEIGKHQKRARQALLARIEQLIDQVLFNPDCTFQ